MGWIYLVSFLVAVFITLSFCKAASDADDESERLWEEYLQKPREIKLESEDKENARLENERDDR
jgi:hypothetical protein